MAKQEELHDEDRARTADSRASASSLWTEHLNGAPLIATAIHAGHQIRGELTPLLAIDDATRSREEDPYTDYWARVVPSWLVPTRSRFEVDLNRDRAEAVYSEPEMAWGLDVFRRRLPDEARDRSLSEYDLFYSELDRMVSDLIQRFGRVVVLDLHSYNHRRGSAGADPADASSNPEVNVGTGSLDRRVYGPLVDRFIADLRRFDFGQRHLDVRENVNFTGRQLARWIHNRYPGRAGVLSVEFKKFFMDEWTGIADIEQVEAIRAALGSTLPGLLDELERLDRVRL